MTASLRASASPDRPRESYWVESRGPLASLVFITPLLVIYEVGVILLGPEAANGAAVWLQQFLRWVGFGQYFLLPLLTICILLAWHHLTHRPWRFSRHVLYGMAGESVLLAVCLWLLARLQGIFLRALAAGPPLGIRSAFGTLVGYFGAGIYEELLFRLILLSLVIALLRWLRLGPRGSTVTAVLLTSLLFAAAHYVGRYGDDFQWYTFIFRFLAGGFFSVLFIYRGFGIAVGTHACYDILVGLALLLAK